MNAPLGATAKFSTPAGPNGTSETLAATRSKCARSRRLSTCWLYMAITSASAAAATRVSWAAACAATMNRPSAAGTRRYSGFTGAMDPRNSSRFHKGHGELWDTACASRRSNMLRDRDDHYLDDLP